MNTLTRWLRFNLVGLLGMALQLAALQLFNHLCHGHYLIATTAALELTLLHNFLWHWNYTWRDRRTNASPLPALIRFHLTNGLTSLIGNLALMRLLVHTFHTPVLIANILAIAACSLANFAFSHLWSFAQPTRTQSPLNPTTIPTTNSGCPMSRL